MPLESRYLSPQELELKYTFDNSARQRVLRNLKRICPPDDKFSAGVVNSIYFDSQDWLLAMEKASSDYLKTKVRVRWYETENDDLHSISNCFLELKRKIGTRRNKVRIPLDKNGVDIRSALSGKDFASEIRSLIAQQAPELSGHNVKPAFMVSYRRRRFVEPTTNSRIALDTNIKAEAVGAGFDFETTHINLPYPVLEVKGYAEELPHALRYINAPNLYKVAFSKYYLCFQSLTGYTQ